MTQGTPPAFKAPVFTCPDPTCQVLAQHAWVSMQYERHGTRVTDQRVFRSECLQCSSPAYWIDEELAWPAPLLGDPASDSLPEQVRELYGEARTVVAYSPRAAAALLRLAVERLVAELGEMKGKLDDRIDRLHKSGELNKGIVDALDAVRVTGNKAVHEGQIDPAAGDDLGVALLLFRIVNRIADDTLGMRSDIDDLLGDKKRPPLAPKGPGASA